MRGGRRDGAGRKPVLTYIERIKVGAACERLWRKAEMENVSHELAELHFNVSDEWEHARLQRGRIDHDEHAINVVEALRIDQAIGADAEPKRVLSVTPMRPYRLRPAIRRRVAEQFKISERRVEDCWQEFRRFEKATDD